MKTVIISLLVASVLVIGVPSVLNESWADSHHIPPTEPYTEPEPELPPLQEPEPERESDTPIEDNSLELENQDLRQQNLELKLENRDLKMQIEFLKDQVDALIKEFGIFTINLNDWFLEQLNK